MKLIKKTIVTILAMNGIIKGNLTASRIVLLLLSYAFTMLVLPQCNYPSFGIAYFALTTALYMGFIFYFLGNAGARARQYWILKYGEEKAFIHFQTILVILFLHNASSSIFICTSTGGSVKLLGASLLVAQGIAVALYLFSNVIAVWATAVLGAPLYFWKDMFLGRPVSDFVESGPYKYFKNPMYNIGRIQFYAAAIYYGSITGFIAAAIGQFLLLLFYWRVEKKFIQRIYLDVPVLAVK